MRDVNVSGRQFIKDEEGLRLVAYLCSARKWTIGYGHTGPDIYSGMSITLELAERLFDADIRKHSAGLDGYVAAQTTPCQWAAMVSLAFNMGIGAIGTSSLVRKFNSRDVMGAADEFLRWKYYDDDPSPEVRHMVEDPALLARRKRERALFLLDMKPSVS